MQKQFLQQQRLHQKSNIPFNQQTQEYYQVIQAQKQLQKNSLTQNYRRVSSQKLNDKYKKNYNKFNTNNNINNVNHPNELKNYTQQNNKKLNLDYMKQQLQKDVVQDPYFFRKQQSQDSLYQRKSHLIINNNIINNNNNQIQKNKNTSQSQILELNQNLQNGGRKSDIYDKIYKTNKYTHPQKNQQQLLQQQQQQQLTKLQNNNNKKNTSFSINKTILLNHRQKQSELQGNNNKARILINKQNTLNEEQLQINNNNNQQKKQNYNTITKQPKNRISQQDIYNQQQQQQQYNQKSQQQFYQSKNRVLKFPQISQQNIISQYKILSQKLQNKRHQTEVILDRSTVIDGGSLFESTINTIQSQDLLDDEDQQIYCDIHSNKLDDSCTQIQQQIQTDRVHYTNNISQKKLQDETLLSFRESTYQQQNQQQYLGSNGFKNFNNFMQYDQDDIPTTTTRRSNSNNSLIKLQNNFKNSINNTNNTTTNVSKKKDDQKSLYYDKSVIQEKVKEQQQQNQQQTQQQQQQQTLQNFGYLKFNNISNQRQQKQLQQQQMSRKNSNTNNNQYNNTTTNKNNTKNNNNFNKQLQQLCSNVNYKNQLQYKQQSQRNYQPTSSRSQQQQF